MLRIRLLLKHCCTCCFCPAVCKAVLPGPSAAARAAAAASNKQRAAAEAAIAAAVSDVLHLLAALKTCAPLMAGEKSHRHAVAMCVNNGACRSSCEICYEVALCHPLPLQLQLPYCHHAIYTHKTAHFLLALFI